MLEYLVRHAGELVSKDQLLAAVWGDRVVTDDSITQCIGEIRSALDDGNRRKLKTLPRRGYRLDLPRQSGADRKHDYPRPKKLVAGLGVIGLVLVVGLVVSMMEERTIVESSLEENSSSQQLEVPGSDILDDLPFLAVLPFEDRGGTALHPFLVEGIHDELITTLAKLDSLRVISRTSVMPYRGTTQALPEIARELGVAHILEGSVEVADDLLRITVQLIDAQTDTHIWAETFDRTLGSAGVFELRGEISQAIAATLQAEMSAALIPEAQVWLVRGQGAYDAYLRGRQYLAGRVAQEAQLATNAFEEATQLDPEFAEAWVGLANSYAQLAQHSVVTQMDSWPLREAAIQRALELDPMLGEAYVARGVLIHDRVEGGYLDDVRKGEEAFLKAIALSPGSADAYQGYAILLNLAYPERIEESINLLQHAVRLNPRSLSVTTNLASAYRFRGLYGMAERQYLKALSWNPSVAYIHMALARLYLDLGRLADAHASALEALRLDPDSVVALSLQGEIKLELEDAIAARNVLDRLQELAPGRPETGVLAVRLAVFEGEGAFALETIEDLYRLYGAEPGLVAFDVSTKLALGDSKAAFAALEQMPAIWDEQLWPQFVRRDPIFGCMVAWLMINHGESVDGRRLLVKSSEYIGETLAAVREHTHAYKPEVCFLASGEHERALASLERQMDHGHVAGWNIFHPMPIYDGIREDARYQAVVDARERYIMAQRDFVTR